MSKQYCYDISNPNDDELDIEKLKQFVQNLYVGTGKDQFAPTDKIPFVTIYARADNSICILLTGQGKKNVERIEAVNNRLKEKDLKYRNGITLGKPYEFDVQVADWWESATHGKPIGTGIRWTSLSHHGPYFTHLMEPYQPMGAKLLYNGVKYPLTPKEEQIAGFYAKRKISETAGDVVDERTKDVVFNKNFWDDFRKYLTPEHQNIFKDFNRIDWSDIIARIEAEKAGELTKEEKIAKRIRTEEKKREYAYAYLDGHREKVGNFTVEPQAIFYGRGENPNRGRVKNEVNPEDVTINIGLSDPVPKPPSGHKWGHIVHDQDAVWVAKWNDSITKDTKYIMFSAEGRFKGEADLVKYEKARKLEKYIDQVRKRYMVDASSQNAVEMQLGTVLYLIDHFGVRVGNERKADEADTVGASTLRVDHVKLQRTGGKSHVVFDFLGKDSIRFYKDLEVPELIYNNFTKLLNGKKSTEQVFNSISSNSINSYLKHIDKSFSAKVFRTRLASEIMYEALKSVKIPKDATKAKAKMLFSKANAEVAAVLNHTRNVSKKAQDSVQKFRDQLATAELELAVAQKQGKSTTAIDKKIESLQSRIEAKTDVMNIAITTSLTNYIDPRLIVSWATNNGVDLTAIYTSTLLRKFNWAVETTKPEWNWMLSPLIGEQDLEPLEGGETEDKPPVKKSQTRKEVVRAKTTTVDGKPIARPKQVKPVAIPKVNKQFVQPKQVPKVALVQRPIDPGPSQWDTFYDQPLTGNYIGPGTKENYEIILNICKNPEKYKFQVAGIPKSVLEWIYPFAKYAVNHKRSTVKANDIIMQFYEAAYGQK
jgi:DNA topoisomerase-1